MKPYWSPFAVIMTMFAIIFGALPSASVSASPLAPTPLELQRRAAQLIEDQRVSGMTAKWGTARLGTARNLFRPDLATPAYVEFSVFSGATPAGFIVLSTGPHDFPITHWNDQGEAPSAHLAKLAQSKGQTIARLFKIDALTYAAENSGGQLIGLYPPKSRLPHRITGQTPAMLDQPREPTHEEWNSTSDDEENPGRHVHSQIGPSWNSAIKLSGWQSWAQFKSGFAGSYQTLILALTREADHDWDIDVAAAERGEGIIAGLGCRPIAALFGGVQASLSGAGAPFLRATVRQRSGLTPVIDLCSVGTPPQGGRAAQLTLSYSNGKSEVLRFFALRQSDVQGASSSTSSTDGQVRNAAPLHSKAAQSNWSAWTYYWAGDSGDQRYYDQIDANTYNNTTSCYSGCGATAWAMLVGWADYQAHNGNAYWAGRTGLYRTNGGTTGRSWTRASATSPWRFATTSTRSAPLAAARPIQEIWTVSGTTSAVVPPPTRMWITIRLVFL
jgi:hypothetical protein